MKVILLENVRKIGSIGEVIEVKRGFARNFLISKKKALFASKENIKEVDKIKSEKGNYGFNAASSEYGDMIKMGILDPAKVTRTALQAAGSVAGLMITTEAMVSEIPEESPAGGMPGGMPPGMGGMDGMM